jgi:excisionase family DNA binding protein
MTYRGGSIVALTKDEGVASDQPRLRRLTYSVDEVADLLGISRSKTYELVARGEIPALPLSGRRRLIARKTIEELLARDPRTNPTPTSANE